MNYISVRAAAVNWGISVRRVQKLCEQGRIPGAEHVGRAWLLPKDTKKPEDQRLTTKKDQDKQPSLSDNLTMLHEAWQLKSHGRDGEFDALLEELFPLVKARNDEPELYGEWLLLSSFKHYPDLKAMTAVLKEAAPYFQGKPSRMILPSSLYPFANFSVFSTYHIKVGAAQEEARFLDQYIFLYASLTGGHGTGADILYLAERLFYGGDLSASETLAYKALYAAQQKGQTTVALISTLLLGHIALCKGDVEGYQRAIDAMSPANQDTEDSTIIQSLSDTLRGVLLLELLHPDTIADWLKAGDFEGLRPIPQLLPFAHFVHAQYLCRKGEFSRLIGFAETIYPDGIEASPVLDALLSLVLATAYLNKGDKNKATTFIQRAADRTLPDGLIFIFLSYIQLLRGMLDPVVKKSYPVCLPAFIQLKSRLNITERRLSRHIVTVTNTVGMTYSLTPKEKSVAMLAARGLKNAEIAQRLSVSENTVRYHLRSVFRKMDIDRRTKLAEKLL